MPIDTKERLQNAQWVFERTIGWIAAAEVKVAAICAIDTAMLAGLGALFITGGPKSTCTNLIGVVALLSILFGIICAAMVLIPRLDGGPSKSMLYFGRITDLAADEYDRQFRDTSDEQLLSDWIAQIHFNARIAQKKHEWAQRCLHLSVIGALPWLGAVLVILSPG